MNDDTAAVDSLSIRIPVLGRMTPVGYGIALAHPVEEKGLICWFKNRHAYLVAVQDADINRRAGRDGSELYFADRFDTYPNGETAIRELIRYGNSEKDEPWETKKSYSHGLWRRAADYLVRLTSRLKLWRT